MPSHKVRVLPEVGALVGEDPSWDVPVYNSTVRTYWVEPETGAIGVDVAETAVAIARMWTSPEAPRGSVTSQ